MMMNSALQSKMHQGIPMNYQPSPINMWELNPALCYMSTGYNTKAANDQIYDMRSHLPTPRMLDKTFGEVD